MRIIHLIAAGFLAAACSTAPSDRARISEVKIRADELTIYMTDGARCSAVPPAEPVRVWTGVTTGCGHALPYEMIYPEGSRNPLRFVFEELFDGLGAPDVIMPRARLTVRDVDGSTRRFISPMSAETNQMQGTL